MTCDDVQQDLKAELDGELGGWRAFLVRRHLGTCEACRAERAELARISGAFRQAETAELPDALRARLIALAPEPQPIPPRRNSFALAGGALAAVSFVVLAFVFVRPTPVGDSSRTTSAPAAPAGNFNLEQKKMSRSEAAVADAAPAESAAKSAAPPAARNRADFAKQDLESVSVVEVTASSRDELLRIAREVSVQVVRREPLELEGSARALENLQRRLDSSAKRSSKFTARFRVLPPTAEPDR